MKRLDGKVALISGTARGQGRAAALRFAAEGALVVGGDPLHEEAVDTQRLIARDGGTALTPSSPPGRVGPPDDVVNAAVLLASDEAAHITGAHLVVDGGWSAVPPGAPLLKGNPE
ncbi:MULTISPECIES: SDR family oxidoreductase [Streptomyces]|uniref:SDR family oxidoreductase n=1 Tax=Streptomyces fimbriatus TaxID=68197 RepID=A0ABW0D7W6_STRFI